MRCRSTQRRPAHGGPGFPAAAKRAGLPPRRPAGTPCAGSGTGERIDAIAYHSGALQDKIHSYKYEGKAGWSLIFGRLLVGWLEAHAEGDPPDLIAANPTYLGPGQPGRGHVERIIRSAATADYDGRWIFDTGTPATIIKTRATEKSAGKSLAEKRAAAAALRQVLDVPDPARTHGRDILVFDDVCTTGYQLNAVAGCLLDRARQPASARWSWPEHRGSERSLDAPPCEEMP